MPKNHKIITWNINSIRSRIDLLRILIEQENPDIILLQETKVKNELFPEVAINNMGYNVSFYGEMRYNGVAILSKYKISNVNYLTHDDFQGKKETRYIDADIMDFKIASIYVPNGRQLNDPHFFYKKNFYESLKDQAVKYKNEKVIFGGDFNVAPDSKSVWGGEKFDGQIICSEEERSWYSSLIKDAGLVDVMENIHHEYTWWDYRWQGFQKNQGYKIDTFFISSNVNLIDSYICKYMRYDKSIIQNYIPSDHAPVCMIFS